MPCSSDHFIPILDEINARLDREARATDPRTPISENHRQSAARHPNWGGRRPGAGAPRGNLNGFRHGRYSRTHQEMALFLAQIPRFQRALIEMSKRRRRKELAAQAGAAAMLAEMLRRVGEAVILGPAIAGVEGHPERNHLEPNQDFLDMLRRHETQIKEILKTQSSETPEKPHPINHPEDGERPYRM